MEKAMNDITEKENDEIEKLNFLDDFMITWMATEEKIGKDTEKILLEGLLQKDLRSYKVIAQKAIPTAYSDRIGVRFEVEVLDEENPAVYDLNQYLTCGFSFPKGDCLRQINSGAQNMCPDNRRNKRPKLYIITILNYDLFGKDYMMYTFDNVCVEVPDIKYNDELQFLFFNTKGNLGGTESIRNILRYIDDSGEPNAVDGVTKQLHEYVTKIKQSPEARRAYREWQMSELKNESYIKGYATGHKNGYNEGRFKGEQRMIVRMGEECGLSEEEITSRVIYHLGYNY